MPATTAAATRTFHVEILKPSHYDDSGYVIQWHRAFIPSNSLACLYALTDDIRERKALGDDVDLQVHVYDETHTVVPVKKIIRRMQQPGHDGVVLLTGVQSNQFPRAADLAATFRAAGIQVAIGGFHVSGCISMLPKLPPEIVAVQNLGVTLYAGEAENKLEGLLKDALAHNMQPIYNYLLDLPGLEGAVTPFLPTKVARRSFNMTAFDVGRGCPFRCSFCTIINVQGRKSRYRDADDVERVVRQYWAHGVNRFFITDDNMARNKNWEAIFDRLIEMREKEGIRLKFLIQVDTMSHKIPNFIEKATRAGCNRVFIGMESINPENLVAAKKYQNRFSEYRTMIQQWRAGGALTHAGYIIGFPADTPESIQRDIETIQRELPIDILEFFILTPLPGSADHRDLDAQGVWMNPDMNIYDSEHVTTAHQRMQPEEWQKLYEHAWHAYYTPEHMETMLRRAQADYGKMSKVAAAILLYYGCYATEGLHPLQCGVLRRKVRTSRRPGMKLENPLTFYPKRVWETAKTYLGVGQLAWKLHQLRAQILKDPNHAAYQDLAITPVKEEDLVVEEPKQGCGDACTPKPVPLVTLSKAA